MIASSFGGGGSCITESSGSFTAPFSVSNAAFSVAASSCFLASSLVMISLRSNRSDWLVTAGNLQNVKTLYCYANTYAAIMCSVSFPKEKL